MIEKINIARIRIKVNELNSVKGNILRRYLIIIKDMFNNIA
tara:strand:- start:418 stop:540 length:123 start_codon:yes stop_codon:yes gene_type:complete